MSSQGGVITMVFVQHWVVLALGMFGRTGLRRIGWNAVLGATITGISVVIYGHGSRTSNIGYLYIAERSSHEG